MSTGTNRSRDSIEKVFELLMRRKKIKRLFSLKQGPFLMGRK